MLLCKRTIALIFIISFSFIYSCKDHEKSSSPVTIDSIKINYWKKNFDSLYEKYTNELTIARKVVALADSLENFEDYLLHDTARRLGYIKGILAKAVCLHDLKNFIKSRESFDKFIVLYNEYKLNLPDYINYAWFTNANIYSRYGDYKKAISLLRHSLAYYRQRQNKENMATSICNLSIPLKELRQYAEAENILHETFQLPLISGERKTKACIELADIYTRQNKLTQADQEIRKAKQYFRSFMDDGDRTSAYADLLSVEGDWQMANHNPAEALKAYNRSLDSAKLSSAQNLRSREIGKIYIAIGKAIEQMGHSDSALYYYNRALFTVINVDTLDNFSLPLQKDLYAENTIAEALFARAECISKSRVEKRKELENAINCWQLAFETEKKLLNAFSYDQSRLFMVQENKLQAENAIAVCYRLFQKTKNSKWASQAFLFAEHNKSFVLNESVRRNIAASLFIGEDSVYTQMQSLQSRIASIEIELNNQKFSSQGDSALVQKLLSDKQQLEESLLQNESAVKIKNPQYSNWLSNEIKSTAEEIINSIISENMAMLEYFAGDSAVYLFSASKGKPLSFVKLSPGVQEASNEFLHFFSDRSLILNKPAEYALSAHALYSYLFAAPPAQGNASLLIIPDGFISLIPFDALITSKASTTAIASFPFLVKQYEINYSFSCKTILAQKQISNKPGKDIITAFAPVFANKERGFQTLQHSAEELDAIKTFYPAGKFYTSSAATLQQFKNNCSNASIIHLATHASAGTDSAIGGIEFYDSTLYLNNIYSLPLKAKLVVLNGCETGAGTVNKTEGLMSLARGFSYAGTQNVVAGLWQTEDKTSGELFSDFYNNLSSNTISGALQKAKLKLIENTAVSQASPFYWAGYICIGIPGEKLNNGKNKDGLFIFIAILLLLTGAFMIIKKRK